MPSSGGQEHPDHQRPRHVGPTQVAIPALLALSAIHQHLVREGCAPRPAWWSRPARAREVHHFAVLAGYGAEAVHPYLAHGNPGPCTRSAG